MLTVQELIKEFNNTKTICGIEISDAQKRALKYAAIRLEQLAEPSEARECEINYHEFSVRKNLCGKCNKCEREHEADMWKTMICCDGCGAKIKRGGG